MDLNPLQVVTQQPKAALHDSYTSLRPTPLRVSSSYASLFFSLQELVLETRFPRLLCG